MKNAIMYYYNLNINDIHQINKIYKFNIKKEFYVLQEIDNIDNINEIYNLSLYLKVRGIYSHQIILNIYNNIITVINNKNYVLLKTKDNLDRKVTINDIIYFSNITSNIKIDKLKRNDWYTLWINKIDYFEYQINELKNKYPLIKESFNYFSGLTENGIQLLEDINYDKICICHNRIKRDYTLFDLYNPLNFIIDYNVRDIAEYFKENILYEDQYNEIKQYINNNLNNQQLLLFFIRLLYPSFYFDLYEKIIKNNLNEIEIQKIVDKIYLYENTIKKTYTLIKSICHVPEIEWLIR